MTSTPHGCQSKLSKMHITLLLDCHWLPVALEAESGRAQDCSDCSLLSPLLSTCPKVLSATPTSCGLPNASSRSLLPLALAFIIPSARARPPSHPLRPSVLGTCWRALSAPHVSLTKLFSKKKKLFTGEWINK